MMMNRQFFYGLIFICTVFESFAISIPKATEVDLLDRNIEDNKYNISVCALVSGEEDFLEEWMEYHSLIGVDHFYLYYLSRSQGLERLMNHYCQKEKVSWVYWPCSILQKKDNPQVWYLAALTTIYQNAIKYRACHESQWVCCLEVSEFLLPVSKNHLQDLIQKYSDYSALLLESVCYKVSNPNETSSKSSIMESKFIIQNPEKDSMKTCKMLIKPQDCSFFICSPFRCILKKHRKSLALSDSFLRVNHYFCRTQSDQEDIPIGDNLYLSDQEFRTKKEDYLDRGFHIFDNDSFILRYAQKLSEKS